MTPPTLTTVDKYAWWSALTHGGLLIAPAKLSEFFVAELESLPRYHIDHLRKDLELMAMGEAQALGALLDTVLEGVLGLSGNQWQKGNQVEPVWAQQLITGEVLKPRRLWRGDFGAVLPIFITDVARLGVGKGRRAVSRIIEWLRRAEQNIAVLTNGKQWRLIHAGSDYDAWCETDSSLWFEEGKPSLALVGWRLLLSKSVLTPPKAGEYSSLLAAIFASRQGQADLSEQLGERVRQAVELLIRETLARHGDLGVDAEGALHAHRSLYLAATRMVMRCVFILFAEARNLLPRDNEIYNRSYSLQSLREQLDRVSGGRASSEQLRNRWSAYPRLLALFRLVYHGCPHEALTIPQYGGGLFQPGEATANNPVLRALTLFEQPDDEQLPSDEVVYRLLDLLTRSPVKVRQGKRATWVTAPVDFSDLSSEYIGILYEGLLDFELRQAEPDNPMIFLNLGNQPVLPLSRLEEMDDKSLEALVEKLKKQAKAAPAGEEREDAEEDSETEDSGSEDPEEETEDNLEEITADLATETLDDQVPALRQRTHQWAIKAVKAGKLVAKPPGKKPEALAKYEADVEQFARRLISRIILPGEWFLVRWGGTRKGSGTFYTRPQLAVPTVKRTLEPLVLSPLAPLKSGEPEQESPPSTGDLGGLISEAQGQNLSPLAPFKSGEPEQESPPSTGNLRGLTSEAQGQNLSPLAPFKSGEPEQESPPSKGDLGGYKLKAPGDILALKICDPACGSASFPVAALRFLTEALWDSLFVHQWLIEDTATGLIRVGIPQEAQPAWFVQVVEEFPLTAEKAEEICKAQLKRYVVENCIYGVDINPLAVELGRLALWIETMDRSLPFTFLDHKIKCGNALVGCWFDRFQDYPVMAWEREGGDKNHTKFVHHFRDKGGKSSGDKWTQAIKNLRGSVVKSELKDLLESLDPSKSRLQFPDFDLPALPEAIHDQALAVFEEIHAQVNDPWRQEAAYREAITESEAIARLKFAFDCWCAVWFWEGDDLEFAPTPNQFYDPPAETRQIVERLARKYQFFHWELEFPDVFSSPASPASKEQKDSSSPPSKGNLGGLTSKAQGQDLSPLAPLQRGEQDAVSPSSKTDLGGLTNLEKGGTGSGFDGIIGNPPWEIQKPNSMEFFSNIDPLYRTYGKQEAINKQVEYFTANPEIERNWIAYNARLKALSNWTKYAGFPFGDPFPPFQGGLGRIKSSFQGSPGQIKPHLSRDAKNTGVFSLSRSKAESDYLHGLWHNRRVKNKGYADPNHPFILQGSADINTYKMFLELSLSLLKDGGRLGLIVPSGIYTDKGATTLRTEFLEFNQWHWLFGFENRDGIFNIHRSFKFCPVIVEKGDKTKSIKATFMQRSLTTWENAERYVLDYPRERVEKFSPKSKAILEIRSERDLTVLTKIYENSILLGDDSPQGWGIQYATEFHMTNDSKLFPPRPKWEAQGYIADEYGHWLKGNWQNLSPLAPLKRGGPEQESLPSKGDLGGLEGDLAPLKSGETESWQDVLSRPQGVILSRDKTLFIRVEEVEDIALPLYEGRMIGQFDFSEKGWVSGKGRSAEWREILFDSKVFEPQFVMSYKDFLGRVQFKKLRTAFLAIGSSTNIRSMISSVIHETPCGNSVPILTTSLSRLGEFKLTFILNSFLYDYALRARLGGINVNYFIIEETPLLKLNLLKICNEVLIMLYGVNFGNFTFIPEWIELRQTKIIDIHKNLYQLWAITPYERLRLRCILDAVVAELYGLEKEDFAWILKECDYPAEQVTDKTFSRTLDPKGFWRVDKEKDPELRHTVLSLIAFHELKKIGLEAFLNLNDGEGWMLPDTLRLADYDLGHDDRAKEPQPVTARFTLEDWDNQPVPNNAPLNYRQRFYPWQLEKTPEQSWAECEYHAENLRLLLKQESAPESPPPPKKSAKLPSDPDYQPPTDLFGNPLQVDLFGNVVE